MKSILSLARPRAALWSLAAVAVLLLAVAAAAEKAAPPDPNAPVADNGAAVSSQYHEEGSAAAPATTATPATHHEPGATVSASTGQPGATVSTNAGQPGASASASTNGPVAQSSQSHSSPVRGEDVMKVFALKYAEAASTANAIKDIFGKRKLGSEPSFSLAVDYRTNALVVRGSAQSLRELEALISQLDVEQPATGNAARKAADLRAGMDARLANANPIAMPNPATAGQQQQYRDRDRMTLAIAAELRNLQQNTSGRRAPESTRSLRQAVEAAFEARQELQRAQLADLRQRLARVEANIDGRQRNKEAIVEHRVKELLDPNLQWTPEGDPLAGPGTPAPSPPTPLGSLGNWPALAPGQNGGDALRQRPQPVIATEPGAGTRGPAAPSVHDPVGLMDSPRAFQKELAEAVGDLRKSEDQVRTVLAELQKRYPDATDDDIHASPFLSAREAARKRVDFLRKVYETQIRLLELDMSRAQGELRSTEDALGRTKQLTDRGLASQSELLEKENAIRAAQVRMEQLQTILKLYEMIPDARPEPPKSEAKAEPKKPDATAKPKTPAAAAPGTSAPEPPKPEATKPEPPRPEPMDPASASGPPKPGNE